ncbi:MAG: hypothetical protein HGA25_11550, partial [Clostridiales bacterium]|nr:hypothetical protein [Clostridiales bacterium]
MEKKEFKLGFLIFLICTMGSILAVTVSGAFFYANSQFMILSGITQLLINKYPQDEQEIINLIKENSGIYYNNQINNDNYLTKYGFQAE